MLEYNIALSFAGEDRLLAEELATILKKNNVSVFYDEHERASLWGKDLYQHLQEVYRDKAEYCVIFLSKNYSEKSWTKHELRQAQARAFMENKEYILPIRIDDTEIPGVNSTTAYLDIRNTSINEVSEILFEKLKITKNIVKENTPIKVKKITTNTNTNNKPRELKVSTENINNSKKTTKNFNDKIHSDKEKKYLQGVSSTISTHINTSGEILFYDYKKKATIIPRFPFKGVLTILFEKNILIQNMPFRVNTKWGSVVHYNFKTLNQEISKALDKSSLSQEAKIDFLEKTTSCVFRNFSNFIFSYDKNGVAVFTREAKYGLINKDGKVITDPTYDLINLHTDFNIASFSKNEEYGIIDYNGKILITSKLKFDQIIDSKNKILRIIKNKKYGLASYETGKIIVQPKYDSLRKRNHYGRSYDVSIGNLHGVINDNGEEIIKPRNIVTALLSKF